MSCIFFYRRRYLTALWRTKSPKAARTPQMSIGIGSSTAAELKKNIRGATIGRKGAYHHSSAIIVNGTL